MNPDLRFLVGRRHLLAALLGVAAANAARQDAEVRPSTFKAVRPRPDATHKLRGA